MQRRAVAGFALSFAFVGVVAACGPDPSSFPTVENATERLVQAWCDRLAQCDPNTVPSASACVSQAGTCTADCGKPSCLTNAQVQQCASLLSSADCTDILPLTLPPQCQCPGSCAAGLADCNGTCADLASDYQNCGSCGVVCATGTTCSSGQCSGEPCAPGFTLCAATCVDLSTDHSNCGACGTSCDNAHVCGNGVCVAATCEPDQGTCTVDADCCTGICASGNDRCGCIPSSATGCGVDSDCCQSTDVCINNTCQ